MRIIGFMRFLVITNREIRARSRRPAVYWLRVAAGLLGILMCVPEFFLAPATAGPAQTGRGVFDGVTSAAFFLCCCASLLTCDSISSERRNGTLGLLVLTRVRRLDVVFGKLSAGLVTSVSGLLALLPMLMLPLLAGGVTGGEAFRRMLALFLGLLVFLAAGLLASSGHEHLARAAQAAVALVAAICIVPFVCLRLRFVPFIGWLSPVTAFWSSSEPVYRAGGAPFYWPTLAGLVAVVCLFIAGSVLMLKYRSLQPEDSMDELVDDNPEFVPPEIAPEQLRWRAASQRLSPLEWIVARERAVRRSLWIGAVFVHLSQTAGGVAASMFGTRAIAYVTHFLLFTIGAVFLAWAASRFFIEARRTGQIELLLTTPGPAAHLVPDQWKALKRLLAWPLLVMITPSLLSGLMFLQLSHSSLAAAMMVSASQTLGILCLVVTICWLAMFWAWNVRSQTAAVIRAVFLGAVVPQFLSWSVFVISGLLPLMLVQLNPGQLLGIFYCLFVCRFVRGRLAGSVPGQTVSWRDMFWFSLRNPAPRRDLIPADVTDPGPA